jgi:hypothetical protein
MIPDLVCAMLIDFVRLRARNCSGLAVFEYLMLIFDVSPNQLGFVIGMVCGRKMLGDIE